MDVMCSLSSCSHDLMMCDMQTTMMLLHAPCTPATCHTHAEPRQACSQPTSSVCHSQTTDTF